MDKAEGVIVVMEIMRMGEGVGNILQNGCHNCLST